MRGPPIQSALSLALLCPATAWASFDEFADEHSPTNLVIRARDLTLTIKGEVELELHDLEGEGGPGHDSPTDTRTIGTRSPFAEIDSFWLALRVGLAEGMQVNSVLEFTQRDASVAVVWADYRALAPCWLHHHLELGYQTPIVALDRRTERYPLAATSYWRQPELHLAWEGRADAGAWLSLTLGLSVAMMRPLGFAAVQDSTSQPGVINLLAYERARTFSGNGPVLGGRLRVAGHGAFVEGFAFSGELAAEAGTDVLRSGFSNYADLPGYSRESGTNQDFRWYGGRVGFDGAGVHALAEAIASREGLLERWGAWGQLSYELRLRDASRLFHTAEPLVRHEVYRIVGSTEVLGSGRALRATAPIYAGAWDYEVTTAALVVLVYRDLVRLRAEYAFIEEGTGVPELDIADEPFENDELLLQAELRF